MKDLFKNRKMLITMFIICALVLIIGGTTAWYVWSSGEENKTVINATMGSATVVFNGGTDLTGQNLKPVVNKEDGIVKTITVQTKNDTLNNISFNLYLDLLSLPDELKDETFKYELYEGTTLVTSGNFEEATTVECKVNSTEDTPVNHIVLVDNKTISTTLSTYTLYIWIDGTMDNDPSMAGKNFHFVLHADGQNAAFVEEPETPLSDFIYVLGSETSVLSEFEYEGDTIYFPDIEISENEVLLIKYVGEGVNVNVPNTYTENDVEHNVTLLTYGVNFHFERPDEVLEFGVFRDNDYIESALLGDNVKIIIIEHAQEDVDNVYHYIDYNNMYGMFSGCTSLVNAPVIPNSVTAMNYTFYDCTSLVNAPEIPNSVTAMDYTFSGCTSLVTAPEIPSSVANMSYTFQNCTNLTGTVRINSKVVGSISYIFSGTSNPITVEVPASSTTDTKISALTTSSGMPSNVTISRFTAS